MKTLLLLKLATAVDTFSFHQQQYFHLVVLSASEKSINSHLLSHRHHHRPIVDIRQSATRWSIFGVCLSVCLYLYCSFIYLVAVANSALSSHHTLYYLSLISSVCLRVRDISLIKAQWEKFKSPEIRSVVIEP